MAVERQRPGSGLIQHSDRGISRPPRPIGPRCPDSASPRPCASITASTPPGTRPGETCSDTSRASTIPAASTLHWVTSAPLRPNEERLNPSTFAGEDQSCRHGSSIAWAFSKERNKLSFNNSLRSCAAISAHQAMEIFVDCPYGPVSVRVPTRLSTMAKL